MWIKSVIWKFRSSFINMIKQVMENRRKCNRTNRGDRVVLRIIALIHSATWIVRYVRIDKKEMWKGDIFHRTEKMMVGGK